jgi:hypothetical protein
MGHEFPRPGREVWPDGDDRPERAPTQNEGWGREVPGNGRLSDADLKAALGQVALARLEQDERSDTGRPADEPR